MHTARTLVRPNGVVNIRLLIYTKEYKKWDDRAADKVNNEDEKIAENPELDDRIYSFSKRDAFITVKDHKDNYMNNTKCRLINHAKSCIAIKMNRI